MKTGGPVKSVPILGHANVEINDRNDRNDRAGDRIARFLEPPGKAARPAESKDGGQKARK
jgi:hypothetical protein